MSKKNILTILTLLIFIALSGCKTEKMAIDNSTVADLDLDRYLGKWYEIARFPNSFEKDLVGVTAEYSLMENGKIKVVNSGYKHDLGGKYKEAVGKAKVPNPDDPANLKVSFFWIFYSDYFVMELDEKNYSWAVIGSSSPDYLWILSREPIISDSLLEDLKTRISKRGYDVSRLHMVKQKE